MSSLAVEGNLVGQWEVQITVVNGHLAKIIAYCYFLAKI